MLKKTFLTSNYESDKPLPIEKKLKSDSIYER